jgi:hypothetical protein
MLKVTPLPFSARAFEELLAEVRAGFVRRGLRTGFSALNVQFHAYLLPS